MPLVYYHVLVEKWVKIQCHLIFLKTRFREVFKYFCEALEPNYCCFNFVFLNINFSYAWEYLCVSERDRVISRERAKKRASEHLCAWEKKHSQVSTVIKITTSACTPPTPTFTWWWHYRMTLRFSLDPIKDIFTYTNALLKDICTM